VASETHTETQYNNQRADCGWPGSFWTACGQHALTTALGGVCSRPLPQERARRDTSWLLATCSV